MTVVDYEEMVRQHESVLADVDRLELLLGSPPADLEPARVRELLINDAQSLHEDLARHFSFEEGDGGYLRAVIEARPGLERRVEKLRIHHREILQRLQRAISATPDRPLEAVRQDIGSAVSLLREHEAAETELVHQVVVEDVGTQD